MDANDEELAFIRVDSRLIRVLRPFQADAERVLGGQKTPGFFALLGIHPIAMRVGFWKNRRCGFPLQWAGGWVFLDWKETIDGGKPAAYKIQRRERPTGDWQDVSTAMDSEMTLVAQPRGKELEYRAVAVNKAGDGEPSNTVMAVLEYRKTRWPKKMM